MMPCVTCKNSGMGVKWMQDKDKDELLELHVKLLKQHYLLVAKVDILEDKILRLLAAKDKEK